MGIYVSKMLDYLLSGFKQDPVRILLLGLDAAGKTSLLYKLKLNESIVTIPTIGFNVETVDTGKGITFTIWDVGGQEKLRALWQHYFQNTEGLFFMVDSADRLRFSEAREELYRMLADPRMDRVPVVLMANKQDLPGAASPAELIDIFCLRDLVGHPWHVQGCCIPRGEGLYESVDAMKNLVVEFRRHK